MVKSYRATYRTDWSLDKTLASNVNASDAAEVEKLIKFWHPCARDIDVQLMTNKQKERYMPE